jgi:hypothetical protein
MGAIYTLGISTGTVIRNNLIHEIWGHEQSGSGGIYPDEGTSGVLVENNVVAGTIYGGFSIHYGRDITARNNIFALSRDRQISRGRADMKTTFSFERNIVLYDGGELMGGSGAITSSGSNVYWCTSAPVRFPDGATLAQWQAQGYERDSVVADPLFADPRRLDFRLKPGSPALKLGFQPIDTRACGLYGPKAWTSLPRAVKRPAFAYPAKPAPRPLLLNEGFEQQDPGTSADQAVTWGEAGEARVRVTDEAAASGRQSLKFADAAGLDYPFNPHIWYVPNLEQGLVALDFDVRLESGAVACVEWRDAASPYNVGPSIVIDGSGELTAAGRAITRLSPGTWSHVRMVAGLGARAAATWRLEVRPAGGSAQVVEGLPCGRGFKKLQWLGFVSNATTAAVYYVDNVQLQTLKR